MRYTRYDEELNRYVVPCLYKAGDGEPIKFYVKSEPIEVIETGNGRIRLSNRLDTVYGEAIDRLGELETLEETYKRVLSLPNCNDCGHQMRNTCGHCPRFGADIRINCPLWKPRKEK